MAFLRATCSHKEGFQWFRPASRKQDASLKLLKDFKWSSLHMETQHGPPEFLSAPPLGIPGGGRFTAIPKASPSDTNTTRYVYVEVKVSLFWWMFFFVLIFLKNLSLISVSLILPDEHTWAKHVVPNTVSCYSGRRTVTWYCPNIGPLWHHNGHIINT